jgi:hypothetical protein
VVKKNKKNEFDGVKRNNFVKKNQKWQRKD